MKHASVRLRIYIAEGSPNSQRALANLHNLCRSQLSVPAEIEVVNVLAEPHRALADGVLVTPTLVRVAPEPRRTIIGDLSNKERVLASLELDSSRRETR